MSDTAAAATAAFVSTAADYNNALVNDVALRILGCVRGVGGWWGC